ncbi:MAG TPA: hypothetical protein DHW07_06600, partial [Gammaproteobacteria bacterium]|nr:hypothetical protein [Gammaproteobacteria bacterium]
MEPKWHTGLLMLAVVIGAVLRVPGMGDALNHDEVYTWEAFASQSFATIATHYPVPNNHVFHSMLVRLASLAFGQSEAALRSPAFISGLLAIPAVWVMVRVVLQSATGAAVAAWIMALAPVHIRYSASARGYSMMILLSVLALLCLWQAMGGHARSWIASPSRLWWGGWAGCAFLAAYTVPSAGLFVLAAGGWDLVDALRGEVATRRQRLVPLVYSSGIALIGIVGAYWPIRSQMAAAGAHFGVDLDADPSAVLSLAWQTLSLVTGGWSGGIALALAALGGAVIMARRTVRGHGRLLLMSAMILLVPIAASFVYGTAPQARGLIFLLPVIVLLGSYSVCQLPSRSLQIAAVVA